VQIPASTIIPSPLPLNNEAFHGDCPVPTTELVGSHVGGGRAVKSGQDASSSGGSRAVHRIRVSEGYSVHSNVMLSDIHVIEP
jgi:hypothetical protein